jgi:transcriptional regulator with XRE-family HTH domain
MRKNKQELPALCIAVKNVRELYGDTQERFARRVEVVAMTISRFERGQAEPSDQRVLGNLYRVARERMEFVKADPIAFDTLHNAAELFSNARVGEAPIRNTESELGQIETVWGPRQTPPQSPREWRLSCAARLAARYFPERAAAMESAAGAAIAIVDDVLSKADAKQIDYQRFEREVFALAEQRAFSELKQGRKEK